MAQDNAVARSLHDLGLAAWFGGSLMGAVGLNGAAAAVDPAQQRLRVATAGWARWTPVNLAGIAAHLAGGGLLLAGSKGRLAGQRGVTTATIAKAALTGLAVAATGSWWVLGARLQRVGAAPLQGATTPTQERPDRVARVQRQLDLLQWVVPGLTGAMLVLNAKLGEQQRPTTVATGLLQGGRKRLPWAALPAALAVGAAVLIAGRRRATSRQPAGQQVPVHAATPSVTAQLPAESSRSRPGSRRRWQRRQQAHGTPQATTPVSGLDRSRRRQG
jgi:hypothetical protein